MCVCILIYVKFISIGFNICFAHFDDFGNYGFWIIYFAKSRQRGRFGFCWFQYLADHPVLQSTPIGAHRKMSINPEDIGQFYGTRAKLWPKTDFYLLIPGKSGFHIFVWFCFCKTKIFCFCNTKIFCFWNDKIHLGGIWEASRGVWRHLEASKGHLGAIPVLE